MIWLFRLEKLEWKAEVHDQIIGNLEILYWRGKKYGSFIQWIMEVVDWQKYEKNWFDKPYCDQ